VFKAQSAKLQQALQRMLKDADDEEAVHDVRVACRRLNVALVNTETLFRKPVVKGTRKRVKTLMSFLGELRDAEVQSERVRALAERTGSEPVKRVAESLEAHTEMLRLRMLGEIERGA
jgi:CHAD domain-containing protein